MLIYQASFILEVFSELDELLVKGTRKLNLRKASKWRRSLTFTMACELCGYGFGDEASRCHCEEIGVGNNFGLTAEAMDSYNRLPTTNTDLVRPMLPGIRGMVGDFEESMGSEMRGVAPLPSGLPVGYRPVGPLLAGPNGPPSGHNEQVPVWSKAPGPRATWHRQDIVDGSGRVFCCGNATACEKLQNHGGRCGRWVVCADCGSDYGATHEETCSLRPGGLELDKPPWMCTKRSFCRLPSGHRGVHARMRLVRNVPPAGSPMLLGGPGPSGSPSSGV